MSGNFSKYTVVSAENITKELQTDLSLGLSSDQIPERLDKHGYNEVAEKRVKWFHILVRQFKSSFVYLLLAASLLAFALKEYMDSGMILLFVAINTTLGFFQEYRSNQALKLLKKYFVKKCTVVRDGKEVLIESRFLVPGDLVKIETGDIIPADVRIIRSNDLVVNESVLTGESVSVEKVASALGVPVTDAYKAKNIGFSGTNVVGGEGYGVVISTGTLSEVGKIAKITDEALHESSFEKGINRFSKFILFLVLGTLFIVFVAHLAMKGGTTRISDLLLFSIALGVGVIPEALPLVITFSLSRGALALAKKNVVVKRLSAIEDLGAVQVLCVDKTGTITENVLAVSEVKAADPVKTLLYAALASPHLFSESGPLANNAFDIAIGGKLTHDQKHFLKAFSTISENPFDPDRRRGSVLVEHNEKKYLVAKGAYEAVLPYVNNVSSVYAEELITWIRNQGMLGARIIAVSYKEWGKTTYTKEDEKTGMHFLGLLAFTDPIKSSAHGAVKKAQALGVKIIIVTGDSKEVSGVVAHKVGIADSPDQVIGAEELFKMPYSEQLEAVEKFSVFVRTSPEQKLKIIQLLQNSYEVGFLGEGINDAPALKAANVAMVVQGATDIAQETSDIVLLNKSLSVIIDGIEEGRKTFANTIKYIKSTLASNFGNFYALAFASLVIEYLPMLPLQILLLNLLSDSPMVVIATDNVDPSEVKTPRSYDVKEITLLATILGLVSTLFDFVFFGVFKRFGPGTLQTNWFIGSILTEIVLVFSMRVPGFFAKTKTWPSRALVLMSIVAAFAAVVIPLTSVGTAIFKFTPPHYWQLGLVFLIVAVYFVATECVKLVYVSRAGVGEAALNPRSERRDSIAKATKSPNRYLAKKW